jgi:prepilin-type N-terminal cleavage/methylation domain-containing protein
VNKRSGFTLIEMMIVLSIIAILVQIAIPRFSLLLAKSRESTTKGNLGILRSAISIYFGDTEGEYPSDNLTSLTVGGKYLGALPMANLPTTDKSPGHGIFTHAVAGALPAAIDDVADGVSGWAYDNSGSGVPSWGQVMVNCSHADAFGTPWSAF